MFWGIGHKVVFPFRNSSKFVPIFLINYQLRIPEYKNDWKSLHHTQVAFGPFMQILIH